MTTFRNVENIALEGTVSEILFIYVQVFISFEKNGNFYWKN